MANHIQVPNYNSSGLSDAKIPDTQAGWEKAITTLLVAMGGSNYVHHAAGMLESMITVAYEQFVIDDEIIGMCCKVLKGIDVDAEHLALDTIANIGPGGNFMTADHTIAHMRKEYFYGNGVTDRRTRDTWVKEGEHDTWSRARMMVNEMLAKKEESYLSEALDKRIREKYDILL